MKGVAHIDKHKESSIESTVPLNFAELYSKSYCLASRTTTLLYWFTLKALTVLFSDTAVFDENALETHCKLLAQQTEDTTSNWSI